MLSQRFTRALSSDTPPRSYFIPNKWPPNSPPGFTTKSGSPISSLPSVSPPLSFRGRSERHRDAPSGSHRRAASRCVRQIRCRSGARLARSRAVHRRCWRDPTTGRRLLVRRVAARHRLLDLSRRPVCAADRRLERHRRGTNGQRVPPRRPPQRLALEELREADRPLTKTELCDRTGLLAADFERLPRDPRRIRERSNGPATATRSTRTRWVPSQPSEASLERSGADCSARFGSSDRPATAENDPRNRSTIRRSSDPGPNRPAIRRFHALARLHRDHAPVGVLPVPLEFPAPKSRSRKTASPATSEWGWLVTPTFQLASS